VRGAITTPLVFTTAAGFVLAGTQGACAAYLVLYLHDVGRLSLVTAGAVFAVFQAAGLIGRIGWGVIADRVGDAIRPLIGLSILAAVCCSAMAVMPVGNVGVAVMLAVLLGLSALGWNALFISLVFEAGPAHRAGSRIGFSLAVALPALVVGPPIFGFVVDHFSYSSGWLAVAAWSMLAPAALLLSPLPTMPR
jgi:sugar phosphate permease